MKKRAEVMHEVIIHIILVGLIFALLFMSTSEKINARGVRQQVLEKQTALLIDSASPGMSFEISKENINGKVKNIELKEGKVHIEIEGLTSLKGYPYFTKYSVEVEETQNKFIIRTK
jgi:hypothetical protein